jgi:hypothetical protein
VGQMEGSRPGECGVRRRLPRASLTCGLQNLPGITADQRRLKKLAWGRWRAAAGGARRARVLAQRRDRGLLGERSCARSLDRLCADLDQMTCLALGGELMR